MKKIVLNSLAALLILTVQQSLSQVTLLSNNTNLTTGVVLNGKGLLIAESDSLWVTNGTAAGTVKLTNAVSFVDSGSAALYNGKLFFTGASSPTGAELWATDGTAAGTTLIKDINTTGNSIPDNFIVYNNALIFTANNGSQGIELWTTDGTAAGTTLLKDINPGAGSSNSSADDISFTVSNGILYFMANNGTNGRELWRTDGTSGGTAMVADITPGSGSTTVRELTSLGANLIIGIAAGTFPLSTFQLWKSNGTAAGTSLIKDFGLSGFSFSFFFPFNEKIYFNATEVNNTGDELWVTDGTTAGTTLVKDINPGKESSNPFLFNAVIINSKFYFQATTTANGAELWVSDGTTAGTQMLKDINTGIASSNPLIYKNYDFTAGGGFTNTLFAGKIFFSSDDGVHGNELWITDGTAAGTVLVKDIKAGRDSGLTAFSFNYYYTAGGIFFAANDGSGNEPWLSNGSDAGTARVADINPGAGSSDPRFLFILNNQLYINANNGDSAATDLFKINQLVTTLPITLLNASATLENAAAVKLDWTTSNEINTSHFIIERSIDAINFSKIGEVKAAGSSSFNINYYYVDHLSIAFNSPKIYYRLQLVDKDGSYKNSQVLSVHLTSTPLQFTFSPNPVQQQLNVMIAGGSAKNMAIRIVDVNGNTVYQQGLSNRVDFYQQSINIEKLQKGLYYIQILTENITLSKKFLKQ